MSNWNSSIIEQFRAKGGKGIPNFGDRLLLLTTRGAKSGKPHTTPLAFTRDGDRYVVIASKGGAPTHPDWYHNIVKYGEAEVEVGTERFHARATALASGPEHDRLYEQQAQVMPGFREYQERATRIIPVIVLERDAAREAAIELAA